MGKAATRKRTTYKHGDPALDYLPVLDARQMLLGNLVGMGWRLALTVLVPIFIGVQLDKRLDSTPSLTLAAFFIAIFASGILIARTYNEMTAQVALDEAKMSKRKLRRIKHD